MNPRAESATWVLGDVHGCWATLQKLLGRLPIDWRRDHLWSVGDLVNRGPRSLEVLRWARDCAARLGDRFVVVLGNHDLYLLAVHAGVAAERPRDTLGAVLAAPDREQLCRWLWARPLLHHTRLADRRRTEVALVHAALAPRWSFAEAGRRARAVERVLRSPAGAELLRRDRGPDPADEQWRDLGCLTRVRMLDRDGQPSEYTGPPEQAPPGLWPWFAHPDRRGFGATVVAGHWAALGLRVMDEVIALDSGCAWGGPLSAVRLEDRATFSEANLDLPDTRACAAD